MSSIPCRIRHLVQGDEQYCRTLNNTGFVRVAHTDTGFVIPNQSRTPKRDRKVFTHLEGVYYRSPETL